MSAKKIKRYLVKQGLTTYSQTTSMSCMTTHPYTIILTFHSKNKTSAFPFKERSGSFLIFSNTEYMQLMASVNVALLISKPHNFFILQNTKQLV